MQARWRRVIAGTVFLRRFRSLHEPPITGSYYNRNLSLPPRFEPSSSSPVTDSRCFSLDFLDAQNTGCRLNIKDSWGSLLLLDRFDFRNQLSDVVICEPLTQSYNVIPPWTPPAGGYLSTELFLLESNDSADAVGGISMSNFRVLCMAHGESIVHAGVFTAAERAWQQTRVHETKMRFIGRAADSLYWYCEGWTVAALNHRTTEVEFSSFELPSADCDPHDPRSIFNIMVTNWPRRGGTHCCRRAQWNSKSLCEAARR
ncbi:hypothetical protein PR202_gb22840 [Eleusine coracana subsp. coracana]|uniref:Uncharacterized protein n=1 Tax=Eleusine coracana subsp. coracana TaxID=191504 RepID=A0AAV5FGQ7_ELECO|nr:hypothetical protein PR202_gb22840 [Eleusine coracana subsp. coracana]